MFSLSTVERWNPLVMSICSFSIFILLCSSREFPSRLRRCYSKCAPPHQNVKSNVAPGIDGTEGPEHPSDSVILSLPKDFLFWFWLLVADWGGGSGG